MDRLDMVAIGYAGLAAIILASIVALSELEVDLGEIFETPHLRKWRRRIWMYPLAIVLAPSILTGVLLLGTIAEVRTTAFLDPVADWGTVGAWLHQWLTRLPLLFELVPYVLTWAAFTALYRLATPARIGWRAASVGGIFTGVVWLLAQGLYIGFQLGASTYRELWGYLAQIPLLLVWIYASWAIVFVGAEVVYAWQNRFAYMPKWRAGGLLSFETIHRATSRVASRILQSVEASGQSATLAVISGEARIPLPMVMESVARLEDLNLLLREKDGWIPAAELERTTIGEIGDRLRRLGESSLPVIGEAPLTDDMTIRQVAEIESRLTDHDSGNS
jgi:YihY family inner membrane protein